MLCSDISVYYLRTALLVLVFCEMFYLASWPCVRGNLMGLWNIVLLYHTVSCLQNNHDRHLMTRPWFRGRHLQFDKHRISIISDARMLHIESHPKCHKRWSYSNIYFPYRIDHRDPYWLYNLDGVMTTKRFPHYWPFHGESGWFPSQRVVNVDILCSLWC